PLISNLTATRASRGRGTPEMNAPLVDRSRTTAGNRCPSVDESATTRRNTAARLGCNCIGPWPIDSTIAGALITRRAARRSSDMLLLSYSGSGGHVAIERGKSEDLGVAGREDHALRRNASDRCRLEVGDDDHLLADELLGGVGLGDAGDDRARCGLAEVDRQVQELLGLGHRGGCQDFSDPELDLAEIVDLDRPDRRGRGRTGGVALGVGLASRWPGGDVG